MLFRQYFLLFVFILGLVGCVKGPEADSSPSVDTLYGAIGSEKSYCSTVSSPATATTITATAQYKYRQVNRLVGLTTAATGSIRRAEVQILDSNGNTIQCGETNATGGISINIPRTAGTYTVKVLSRAENNYMKASVLNNPTSMTPYSIWGSFTLSGSETSKAVTLPIADYTNSLEGGAFNILDQIYQANEFIRSNSTCTNLGSICTALSGSIDKVRVFWTPGLSPGAYYGSPTASISFYISSDDTSLGMATGIYLMGGVNGSTCVDTDHFDNSVILHEYGHFLEKAKAYSDSPGGSHSGTSQVDARLAWSEGWGNYFQGAVRSDSHYVDTTGNIDCSGGTGISITLDLENQIQDVPSQSGEGIFREVSVSRALWDLQESNAGGDTKGANLGFGPIWRTFSSSPSGFRSTDVHFRNMGHFNEFLRADVAAQAAGMLTNFDAVLTNEKQLATRREYAYVVTPQAAGCSFSITGISGSQNYAAAHDFFSYYYDGTSTHATVTMKYSASSGTPSDLDLYAWTENYAFTDSSTLVSSSERFYPESGSTGVEVISFSGRSPGYYLIHVAVDPNSVNQTANFYFETAGGGKRLCP